MARKLLINGKIYEATGSRKVAFNGAIYEETVSAESSQTLHPFPLPKEFVPGYSTKKKPTIPVEIDWDVQESRDLLAYFVVINGQFVDMVSGAILPSPNKLPISIKEGEESLLFNADSYYTDPRNKAYWDGDPHGKTIVARISKNATAPKDLLCKGSAGPKGWLLEADDQIKFNVGGGAKIVSNTNALPTSLKLYDVCVYVDNAGGSVYVNNVDETATSSAYTYSGDSTAGLTIGGVSANDYKGHISYIAVYDRHITATERQQFTKNRYKLLKQAIDTVYYTADAGGGTTVTGTLETLTLTEYAATITTATATNVTGTLETLTLTEYPATITDLERTSVTGTLETLTLTEYAASVSTGTNITGTLETLTLTEFPATITADTNVTGTLETLTLTEYPATITEGAATNVTGTLETLTLTEYPAAITYTQAVYATLETLTLTTFNADISYTSLDVEEEKTTGGWDYPQRPDPYKERVKQGIIEPKKPIKKAKLVKRVEEIPTDFKQVKSLEQVQAKQKELQELQQLHETVKRRGIEKKLKEAADKEIVIRINLALNELEQRKQQIEEQDMVFVIMMLAA